MSVKSALVSRSAVLGGLASSVFITSLARSARAADPIVLRVGAAPTDPTAEIFFGRDQGFYKAAGLDVQFSAMRNTGALAAALAAGSLDIIAGSIVPIAEAYGRGLDFRIIAPGQVYDGSAQLAIAVALGSKVATASDLNGKTIAVNGLKDLTHLCALSWVDAKGGDWKSVKAVEIPFPEMGVALSQGRVDAAVVVEPFLSLLRGKIAVVGDAMAGIGHPSLVTAYAGKLSWLAQNRDAGKRFADAMLKIAAWANTHHEESGAILAKYTPIERDTIRTMARAVFATSPLTAATMQPVLDASTKYFDEKKVPAAELIWTA